MKSLFSYILKNTAIIFFISSGIACNKNQKDDSQDRDRAKHRVISDPKMQKKYTEFKVPDKPASKSGSKIQTLILNYNAIACTCAQWSTSDKEEKIGKKNYYWLEPADKSLIDADHLFDGTHLPVKIKVTGQVITEKGFPKNKNLSKVNEKESGKVFRYTKIEVLDK